MITTRRATSNDTQEVQTVMDAAYETVRDVYRPKSNAIPTSENANLMAGAVCVYSEGAALHVSQLAVVPKFRKRGVARALLQSANDAAIERGAIKLRLNTIQETGNVAIFERLGFAVDSTTEATWCISERFPQLNDVSMTRQCISSGD